ncbi:YHS domain-containing (seleno)protein [Polycladidibacter hongkongensis]|uniref:YHS domain-containing (seleno)protein n=1 Tax=Polycladidibacter hongkongensis TaxID=1647556 RepID=UPI0008337D3C|nr:YHS domain-containing (seleno)protein [Pseudovibrio hongkongensis]
MPRYLRENLTKAGRLCRMLTGFVLFWFLACLHIQPVLAESVGERAWASTIGVALGGVDPVAYFTNRQVLSGSRKHRLIWRNKTWLFVNEGNKRAFQKAPQAYAPVLGGCDVYRLAQGVYTKGLPAIYALYNGRLLLFHARANRYLFLSAPEYFLKEALRQEATNCGEG